jgi:AmmeMemoRadiSam system protein A
MSISAFTKSDKEFLLAVARTAVASTLGQGSRIATPENLSAAVYEKRGCFVTLHKAGSLRGCIGTIEPRVALIAGVEENARNAAFYDPRFPSLKAAELSTVTFEVSVLTVPRKLVFTDGENLKQQLKPGVHGVILARGGFRSTFLPQVWEQLPDKETFLMHLCRKGGMDGRCWQDTRTTVQVYEAEHFSE